MIVFRLNQYFDRIGEIREYHSLIWTERWGSSGDFEMVVPYRISDAELKPGNILETSDRTMSPMLIETITRNFNSGRRESLIIKGRSLDILSKYIYYKTQPILRAPVEGLARALFLRATSYDAHKTTYDRYLDLNMFTTSIGSENSEYMEYLVKTDTSVYDQVVDILKMSNGGYTITRNHNKPYGSNAAAFNIRFDKMRINDSATLLPSMGDFESFSSIESISNYMNVVGKKTLDRHGKDHYSFGILPSRHNAVLDREYNRRMTFLDLTNTLKPNDFPSWESYWKAIVTEEKKELAKHKYIEVFDGKISNNLRYKYGVDYKLGDVLTIINDGKKYKALVSEFIRSYNKDGYESYPSIISI